MNTGKIQKFWHEFFELGIGLKALSAVLEIIGGVLLIFVTPATIDRVAWYLTRAELLEDAHDVIANYLLKVGTSVTHGAWIFTIIYLLSHGLVKLFLVYNLWQKNLWAYPLSIVIFTAFGLYQVYSYYFSHSLGMLILIIGDVIVIGLTWHEYSYMKKLHGSML